MLFRASHILLALTLLATVRAAVFVPTEIDWNALGTGTTADVVVESSATPGISPNVFTNAANSLDGLAGNALYQAGLFGAGGISANGSFSGIVGGNSYTFQIYDYGNGTGLVKNALKLDNTGNQSMFLATPGTYSQIALMGFSTGTDATLDGTINFSDNSTQSFSNILLSDWFGGTTTNSLYSFENRVNTANGVQDVRVGGNIYVLTFDSLYPNKTITGITVNNPTSNAHAFILGAAVVPEPAVAALFTAALCAMLFLRKRRMV